MSQVVRELCASGGGRPGGQLLGDGVPVHRRQTLTGTPDEPSGRPGPDETRARVHLHRTVERAWQDRLHHPLDEEVAATW